ncbi:hypothetical protein [Carnobacterium sp. ISL-102]|uniref:hypothetical protein n=1 Tax=Carnobacterium sp. ISL-102 TaxID=2819142 RepID=UPI002034C230|nr:hypothetical protein [Carnobacterium sp. ISL-102]
MNDNEVYSYPKASIIVFKTTSTNEDTNNSEGTDNNSNISGFNDGSTYKNNKSKENENGQGSNGIPVYTYKKECYRCKKETSIYTYCLFVSNQESLFFPWDKHRLFKEQNFELGILHMKEPRIEFYPINLLGDFSNLDAKMMRKFPTIKKRYSETRRETYCMNLCEYCNAKQGEYFVYWDMNEFISLMTNLSIICYI